MRHREVKQLTLGHTAISWAEQNSALCLSNAVAQPAKGDLALIKAILLRRYMLNSDF